MLKMKTVFLTLGVAGLCFISYVAGFGYAILEFNIDLFTPIGKYYVRLTEPILIEVNNSKIQLPEGTVLYYEYYESTDQPRGACLEIVPNGRLYDDRFEVIRKLDTYEVPREYYYSQARE